MHPFPIPAVIVALLLVACGGSTTPLGAPPPSSAPTAAASMHPTDPGSPEPEETLSTAPRRSADPQPVAAGGDDDDGDGDGESRPFGNPTPGPAAHNTMPLDVRLSRTCARPGDQMQATAKTLPWSKLAFAANYEEDDQGYVPDFQYVEDEMNPTGTYTWTWVIRPSIDPGEALVTVVAAKDDKGASYNAPFRVSRSC